MQAREPVGGALLHGVRPGAGAALPQTVFTNVPEGVTVSSESAMIVDNVWVGEQLPLLPEPTTALLLACGLVGLGVRRRLH